MRWYAVGVHTRQEKAAAEALRERGFDVYLPTRIERRPWSDRIQKLEMALFPGYLFVHAELTAHSRVEMLKVRQVYELVGRLPGDPAIARHIPDAQIESLQTLVASDRAVDQIDALIKGTEVVVGAGPLRGVRGVVVEEADGRRRLAVQITLLGRAVRTTLSADDVLIENEGGPAHAEGDR